MPRGRGPRRLLPQPLGAWIHRSQTIFRQPRAVADDVWNNMTESQKKDYLCQEFVRSIPTGLRGIVVKKGEVLEQLPAGAKSDMTVDELYRRMTNARPRLVRAVPSADSNVVAQIA